MEVAGVPFRGTNPCLSITLGGGVEGLGGRRLPRARLYGKMVAWASSGLGSIP